MEMIDRNLNWDVQEKAIHCDNIIVSNKKALVRTDNQKVLAVLSNSYKLFSNNDLKDLCRDIERNTHYRLNRFVELGGGKKVLAFLENIDLQSINGTPVKEFLVIGNSFDGTSSLFVGYNSHMCRCENQFTDATRILSSKHLNGKMNADLTFKDVLSHFEHQKMSTLRKFQKMEQTKVSGREINRLIKLLLGETDQEQMSPKEQKLRASVRREMAHFGNNAWGLFNGVTHYTSNVINDGNNSFGNVSGSSQRMNHQAIQFLMQLEGHYNI